jgi:hypothetical protein
MKTPHMIGAHPKRNGINPSRTRASTCPNARQFSEAYIAWRNRKGRAMLVHTKQTISP